MLTFCAKRYINLKYIKPIRVKIPILFYTSIIHRYYPVRIIPLDYIMKVTSKFGLLREVPGIIVERKGHYSSLASLPPPLSMTRRAS